MANEMINNVCCHGDARDSFYVGGSCWQPCTCWVGAQYRIGTYSLCRTCDQAIMHLSLSLSLYLSFSSLVFPIPFARLSFSVVSTCHIFPARFLRRSAWNPDITSSGVTRNSGAPGQNIEWGPINRGPWVSFPVGGTEQGIVVSTYSTVSPGKVLKIDSYFGRGWILPTGVWTHIFVWNYHIL